MKKMNQLIAFTILLSLFTGQINGQNDEEDSSSAYLESHKASYKSVILPLGAIIVAGFVLTTTNHHHAGSSSSHFSHSQVNAANSQAGRFINSASYQSGFGGFHSPLSSVVGTNYHGSSTSYQPSSTTSYQSN